MLGMRFAPRARAPRRHAACSRTAGGPRTRCRRARGRSARSSGRGSGRTARAGTAARSPGGRGGSSDAAPVTELAISSEEMLGVVVAALAPVGVRQQLAVRSDQPGVAVRELGGADRGRAASRACRRARGRPGRPSRRTPRRPAPSRARARSCGRSPAARASARPRSGGRPPARASISANRAGLEQSSLTMQTQLRWVWPRIDSTWRRNRSIGRFVGGHADRHERPVGRRQLTVDGSTVDAGLRWAAPRHRTPAQLRALLDRSAAGRGRELELVRRSRAGTRTSRPEAAAEAASEARLATAPRAGRGAASVRAHGLWPRRRPRSSATRLGALREKHEPHTNSGCPRPTPSALREGRSRGER